MARTVGRSVMGTIISIMLCLLTQLPAASTLGAAPAEQDERAAQEIIAGLNAWRLSENVWPLKPNPTLERLALHQAEYLLALSTLPGGEAIHVGSHGEQPPQRALEAPFNWPAYGRLDRVNIGEIAAVGNVGFALNYWRNSDIHRRTVVNAGYREIGVAALPYRSAYLFIAVFGSRPDVLPALVNPETHQLQLTNETYRWKSTGALIQEAKQVRLFASDGRPLNKEPIPWQQKIAIPDGAGDKLYVLYSDGAAQVLTEIDLNRDVVIMPGHIPSPVVVAIQASPSAVAGQPTAIAAPGISGVPVTNTPRAPTRVPTRLPSPTPAATVTPTPAAGRLVIVYDNLSLSLINTSSGPVDISRLQLVSMSAGVTFSATRWVQVSQVPLQSFPTRQCLQIKPVNRAVLMAPECRIVRGVVEFLPRQFFWTQASFDVRVGNTVLATCQSSAGRCEVELPR